jgi:hypothetical protein
MRGRDANAKRFRHSVAKVDRKSAEPVVELGHGLGLPA